MRWNTALPATLLALLAFGAQAQTLAPKLDARLAGPRSPVLVRAERTLPAWSASEDGCPS